MRVIGLMSGTSLDGVDAAVLETDGRSVHSFGPSLTLPYGVELRAGLKNLIDRASSAHSAESRRIEAELTAMHVAAIDALDTRAELIGFHGQTIFHAPAQGITWQIGDAQALARATGTRVACDFRLADVAAGGQGAPLVPLFHAALAGDTPKPVLVVNIGGVANLTWIGDDADRILACDTGPGNALLDDFMALRTGIPMDRDGAAARAGRADAAVLADLLADPYFARPAPKSLDRQHFAAALDAVAALSTADGAATLVALTARAIAGTVLPAAPARVLVTGGGRKNAAIMAALRAAFAVPVTGVEAAGWDGDALEAQCFGFLAVRVLLGLPLSLPGTTGVRAAMPGGRIVSP